ncbi:hypothetical protein [Alteromonas sp. W12]|uniref:hypothetical protein n=1 Tax=Alteromonas sp. W12 TaxID=1772289 RepID=UPI001115089C|nr:hypothetical protein [Alteromonas sp. W12]
MNKGSSISIYIAPDNSGVAIQHIPSYRILFLPLKYERLARAWQASVSFPELPKIGERRFGLSEDDISEVTDLLAENNLID